MFTTDNGTKGQKLVADAIASFDVVTAKLNEGVALMSQQHSENVDEIAILSQDNTLLEATMERSNRIVDRIRDLLA